MKIEISNEEVLGIQSATAFLNKDVKDALIQLQKEVARQIDRVSSDNRHTVITEHLLARLTQVVIAGEGHMQQVAARRAVQIDG